jgi:ribonuclease HI
VLLATSYILSAKLQPIWGGHEDGKMSERDRVTIYCDGACSGNQFKGNRGGWGAVLSYHDAVKEVHGGEKNTSNQRMELTACIEALQRLKGKGLGVDVFSDSAYVVNGMQQRWYDRWERNGWLNAQRKPVENRDLWERLLAIVRSHDVTFHKVTGHSGIDLNERADELARLGISELV